MQENVTLAKSMKHTPKQQTWAALRRWHSDWRRTGGVVDGEGEGVAGAAVAAKSLLKSRAPILNCRRKRKAGGGRPYINHSVRQELYEWFAGIRHAIDWKALIG